jgi:hypothetical protein
MSEFRKRLLRRSVGVAIALAIVGYVFAEVFLVLLRMNGGASDPANDAVRWKTPLTMAGIGVVLQIVVETVLYAVRPKKHAGVADSSIAANPSKMQSGSTTS